MSAVVGIVVGLITGIISGCGVGGGSLLIVYLTTFTAMDQYTAGGVNLLYFLCCAPTALIAHVRHRRVDTSAVWWCALAGILTSAVAAVVASQMSVALLRRLFGVLLLYIGIRELLATRKKTSDDRR